MKKTVKKLTLSKETLRSLQAHDLKEVDGGGTRLCGGTLACTDSCNPNTCLC